MKGQQSVIILYVFKKKRPKKHTNKILLKTETTVLQSYYDIDTATNAEMVGTKKENQSRLFDKLGKLRKMPRILY